MEDRNLVEETRNKELRLLDKSKKGIFRVIFSRTGIILALIIMEIALLLFGLSRFAEHTTELAGFVVAFHLATIVALINSEMDATAKNTWMLIISIIPVIGPLFYIYTKVDPGSYRLRKAVERRQLESHELLSENTEDRKRLQAENPGVAALSAYLSSTGNYPVFSGTKVTYYPLGEYKWYAMLDDLKEASEFIFLEYFIIDEGTMWGQILEILAEKAAAGVEVRVMYDGMCEFSTLTRDYPEKMERLGIQCRTFAPVMPLISTYYNNRDHRKICVIDGKVAYNGGVNLADEYINAIERFGHWKDTAVRLEGPAVNGFTNMFLEMWTLMEKTPRVSPYLKEIPLFENAPGYVIPYGDNPLDKEKAGENVYLDFLYQATGYVHIMTPYLILDDVMLTALKTTARKGIDVKLILPGIPDKKAVYTLAKSYFATLINAGVKIYYYTPGFVHAKVFVSDGCKATVGTINLDYRSLYHHFECGTYLYDVPCIRDIEEDFQYTLKSCHQVTLEDIQNEPFYVKLLGSLLRMVATLM